MEPLTEMHLLLREHGWEPEIERDNGRMEAPRSQRIGDLHWPLGDDRGAVKGQGQLWDEYFASRAQICVSTRWRGRAFCQRSNQRRDS